MNQSRSIVKQASILAIAGILVRIIGVLYRSPLTHLIGDEGMGYYSSAYEIYTLILLVSSYSIPTAISKLLSEKLVLKQYNNVKKILQCAFIYIFVIGGGAALVTFIIAPYIVPTNAVIALRVLCPTIFLSGLLGVFRGYFQAHQKTVYTSVSQIIEQVFNAVISVFAAYLFIQPYLNVQGTALASHGAAGSSLGTGFGVLAGLIYMVLLFMRKSQHPVIDEDADPYVDTYHTIFKMILSIVTPIIVATCIYNSVTTFEMYIYYGLKGTAIEQSTMWGLYLGKYSVLRNVPVALASAMSTAAIPAIAGSWSIQDRRQTRENVKSAVRVTMLILIPAAVGMSVLAFPIMGFIFPQAESLRISTLMLTIGSPSIIFFGLSTLTNGILQAIGEVQKPLKNAAIALVAHCVLVIALLKFTSLDLYAIVIANGLYAVHVSYLNQKTLRQMVHFKQGLKKTFLLPFIASLIMGLGVGLCYYGLFFITRKVFIPLMISIVLGIIIYFMIIFYFYSDNPEELSAIPYSNRMMSAFKKYILRQ